MDNWSQLGEGHSVFFRRKGIRGTERGKGEEVSLRNWEERVVWGEEWEVDLNKHIVQILDKIYFQRHETSGKCTSQESPALMMRPAPLQSG